MKKRPTTYRAAGVDQRQANQFIRSIVRISRKTTGKIGGFGGLFELQKGSNGSGSLLVASADGVGTKLLLAKKLGIYRGLGIDLVAMNVNDLICTGAKPLFFLDYVATGKLNAKVLRQVMQGIIQGCQESDCLLLGGETAQMPLLYRQGDFDLAGFSVGQVERKKLITGQTIKPGDVVLGLASSGPHSNGFSLIQKVLSSGQLRRLGKKLLAPTQIYVKPVLGLLNARVKVSGLAHITGGSFEEKIGRILPKRVNLEIEKGAWPVPSVFQEIRKAGVAEAEMYRTFNMGIGMAVILAPSQLKKAQSVLKRYKLKNWVIGEAVRGKAGQSNGKVLIW